MVGIRQMKDRIQVLEALYAAAPTGPYPHIEEAIGSSLYDLLQDWNERESYAEAYAHITGLREECEKLGINFGELCTQYFAPDYEQAIDALHLAAEAEKTSETLEHTHDGRGYYQFCPACKTGVDR